MALRELGQPEESKEHFSKAVEAFQKELARNPDSMEAALGLGAALAEVGRLDEAVKYLEQALNIDPFDVEKHIWLAQTLVVQERYDQAIEKLRQSIHFMLSQGRRDDADKLQRFMDDIKLEKSESKQ
ncbi:MAG: tetratricopeptide repeat protein [Planctomycetota bacterium]